MFWKVFSQESSEGRITQALGLNVVADWQCCINGCISALSKKICKMLRSFHCSLKNPFLSLSPLASVSQSTCRGQNTFNSPEVSTKKKKTFWQLQDYTISNMHMHTCIFKLINKITFKAVRTSVGRGARERQKSCFVLETKYIWDIIKHHPSLLL